MNALDTIKAILSTPHDTAAAREALSKALTGRVIDNPPKDKEKETKP